MCGRSGWFLCDGCERKSEIEWEVRKMVWSIAEGPHVLY